MELARRPRAGGGRRSTSTAIPYDYIDPETVKNTADLRAKYDVIIFGPGGGQAIVEGTPMWQNPIPWKNTPETPNIGTWAQTDDTRIGMGLDGLIHLRDFIAKGGVFIGSNSSAEFAIANNFAYGVSYSRAASATRVVGSLLRTKLVDEASPIVYGVPDNLAMYSNSGDYFTRQLQRWRRRARRLRRSARRSRAADAEAAGGEPADRARHGGRPGRRPGTAGLCGDQPHAGADAASRAAVAVQPADRRAVEAEPGQPHPAGSSGRGWRCASTRRARCSSPACSTAARDIAQRPVVVDVPVGKGHVVLFANNPIYRGETIGSYFLVFNTILNFDSLNAGRKLDEK